MLRLSENGKLVGVYHHNIKSFCWSYLKVWGIWQIEVTCRSTSSELNCSVLEQPSSTLAPHSPPPDWHSTQNPFAPFFLTAPTFQRMSLSKINKVQDTAPPPPSLVVRLFRTCAAMPLWPSTTCIMSKSFCPGGTVHLTKAALYTGCSLQLKWVAAKPRNKLVAL